MAAVELHADEAVQPLAYSVAQAAQLLGLHRDTVYSLIRSGELRARKLRSTTTGRSTRTLIERAELVRFLDELPESGGAS